MSTQMCLFSRARPGKAAPTKRIRGFLALPGEIRNMVYEYYFQREFRCEFAARGSQFKQKKVPTVKLRSNLIHTSIDNTLIDTKAVDEQPIILRISRLLGKYNVVQGLQTNWLASVCSLILVCKLIHAETLALLYHNTTFVFDSPRRINNFLNVIPKLKLEDVTKLQLHYLAYGEPRRLDEVCWRDKHIKSWTRACKAASRRLHNLRNLKIWVQPPYYYHLSLREHWMQPILHFRRLTCASKLAGSSANAAPGRQNRRVLETFNMHIQRDLRSAHMQRSLSFTQELDKAELDMRALFCQAVRSAIFGAKEKHAMSDCRKAWIALPRWQQLYIPIHTSSYH